LRINKLGRTNIKVSRICLGTMTFGEQNNSKDAYRQLDLAIDYGVNFLDTAEAYSFPGRPKTQGSSEKIIGNWLHDRGNRDKIVVASKITGPSKERSHIRGGELRYTRKQITEAVDLSLKRLKTDYIDLYQTHWPERKSNYFGKLGYSHAEEEDNITPLEEQLGALSEQVKAGKIRAIGVSNETAWGLMSFLKISEQTGLTRIAAIQNPFNLICRQFEIGLAEASIREDVGLLAYSPLAFGALTGKYLNGHLPKNSRHKLFPQFIRYFNSGGIKATKAYVALAKKHGIEPSQMALAFVNSQQFLTSSIIGATNEEQLKSNLKTEDMVLSDEIKEKIEAIHIENSNPSP
jgi:aryl-alcohol dehydrogenase-like predicted oxidoreductase